MSKPETKRSHGQMRHSQRADTSRKGIQTPQDWSLSARQAQDPPLASSPTFSGATGPQGLRLRAVVAEKAREGLAKLPGGASHRPRKRPEAYHHRELPSLPGRKHALPNAARGDREISGQQKCCDALPSTMYKLLEESERNFSSPCKHTP